LLSVVIFFCCVVLCASFHVVSLFFIF
jgi:hypothetical protein